jgi:hypothetical protein
VWRGNPALQGYLIILINCPWAWEGPGGFTVVQEDFMQINLVARSGESAWAVAPWFCGEVTGEAGRISAVAFRLLSFAQDIHSSF